MHFSSFGHSGHVLATAQAHTLYKTKDTDDTVPYPSETQPLCWD